VVERVLEHAWDNVDRLHHLLTVGTGTGATNVDDGAAAWPGEDATRRLDNPTPTLTHAPVSTRNLKVGATREDTDHLRAQRSQLTIIHGDNDEIVPVEMGRSLAALAAATASASVGAEYVEVAGGDHNRILGDPMVRAAIYSAMDGASALQETRRLKP
jgi:pimeloyl-ACP methyl ester carboxylesterase